MKNNRHKNEWIESAMNSTQGMSRAQPSDGLYEKVLLGINDHKPVSIVPLRIKQWAAAAILLLALNIGSVIYYTAHNNKTRASGADNTFAVEIQPVSTYNY